MGCDVPRVAWHATTRHGRLRWAFLDTAALTEFHHDTCLLKKQVQASAACGTVLQACVAHAAWHTARLPTGAAPEAGWAHKVVQVQRATPCHQE